MQSFIERTCTDFEKADYYSRIRDLTGFDLSHQSANIPAPKKESRNNAAVVRNIEPLKNGRTLAEHGVLWMILNSKLAADQFKDRLVFSKIQSVKNCHYIVTTCIEIWTISILMY